MINQKKLAALKNNITSVINDVYDLQDCIENDDPSTATYHVNEAIRELMYAMDFVEDFMKETEKEALLIKENKTLCALYTEYTTVRDLIGSEE